MYKHPTYIDVDNLLKICPLKHKPARYNKEGDLVAPTQIKHNQFNVSQIFRYHPYWKGRLQFDEIARTVYLNHTNPSRYDSTDPNLPLPVYDHPPQWKPYSDLDAYIFIDWLTDWYDVNTNKDTVLAAVGVVARETCTNVLKEYLESLEPWKEEEEESKIETWLIRYFGVVDTILARAYSKKFLIGVLARIFLSTLEKPVKMDCVLSLYGGQGLHKSQALEALCFSWVFGRRYFSDQAIDFSNKDAVLTIQGKVIYELKELAKRTKDRNLEKAFIDNIIDRIRSPFNRLVEDFVRITVFVITTNDREILTDPTGSRRFWPLELGVNWPKNRKIDIYSLALEAEDLWREALWNLKQYMKWDAKLKENLAQPQTEETKKERTEILKAREPFNWWLNDDQEELREQESLQFTDEHPLTQKILEQVTILGAPITLDRIMDGVFTETNEKNRKNKAIVKDILLTQGYRQYRHVNTNKTTVRAWRK